ncbi:hypothetical protein [Jiangella asiatica]|uniref:Alpha/beta hydrolase n=1 Tax=Jiangella asiatica TaxID=2530372 RepID=A0A4R5DBM5_9ACTN|nr:hypothetical protein [Jiangella asiatica]TDE08954.1 hypothetical protein E1269_16170 [Jiangella asiatica]
MMPGTVVLVPGPLDPDSVWADVASRLPYSAVAPDGAADRPPYAVGWVASLAAPLHASAPRGPLVVVGHGTAGPLLPALARTQRAARRHVGGYVFVDATLPRPGAPSQLDLLRAADPDTADAAHAALHEPGTATWPPAAARPRDHDFWTERLPPAPDWPDAPCAYVSTGGLVPGVGPVDFWARSARARAWPVSTVDDGDDLATALAEVIANLP